MELFYQKHIFKKTFYVLNHKLNDNALLIFINNSAFHKISRDKNYQKLERLRESKPLQVNWCQVYYYKPFQERRHLALNNLLGLSKPLLENQIGDISLLNCH